MQLCQDLLKHLATLLIELHKTRTVGWNKNSCLQLKRYSELWCQECKCQAWERC